MIGNSSTLTDETTGQRYALDAIESYDPDEHSLKRWKQDGWSITYMEPYDKTMIAMSGKKRLELFAKLRDMARYNDGEHKLTLRVPSVASMAADFGVTRQFLTNILRTLRESDFLIKDGDRYYINPFQYMVGIKSDEQVISQATWINMKNTQSTL